MAHYIIKIDDKYGVWSTIVDAPVSKLMSLDELRMYHQYQYGANPSDFEARLNRVNSTGISGIGVSKIDCLKNNRFGNNENRLTVKNVIAKWKKM